MISKNLFGNLIFPEKTVKQVAVLPFVILGDEAKILLLTSRRRGRWIMPKGWPEKGNSLSASAMTEAIEEAGLAGHVANRAIGTYTYTKRMKRGYEISSNVSVYPMMVSHHLLDWPEKDQRTFGWFSLAEAEDLLDDAEAAKLLGSISGPRAVERLTACFDEAPDAPNTVPSPSFVRALADMVGL